MPWPDLWTTRVAVYVAWAALLGIDTHIADQVAVPCVERADADQRRSHPSSGLGFSDGGGGVHRAFLQMPPPGVVSFVYPPTPPL